jgi:hypothetical protein
VSKNHITITQVDNGYKITMNDYAGADRKRGEFVARDLAELQQVLADRVYPVLAAAETPKPIIANVPGMPMFNPVDHER